MKKILFRKLLQDYMTFFLIALLSTTEFKGEMTPAVEYIDENGDIHLAAVYDLEIVQ